MSGVLGKADSGAVCHTAMLWAICWPRISSMNSSSFSSKIVSMATACARMASSVSAATPAAMRRRMLGAVLAADKLVAEAMNIDDFDRRRFRQRPRSVCSTLRRLSLDSWAWPQMATSSSRRENTRCGCCSSTSTSRIAFGGKASVSSPSVTACAAGSKASGPKASRSIAVRRRRGAAGPAGGPRLP